MIQEKYMVWDPHCYEEEDGLQVDAIDAKEAALKGANLYNEDGDYLREMCLDGTVLCVRKGSGPVQRFRVYAWTSTNYIATSEEVTP